ncbi:hypothetical protein F4821DRAFT_257437 [Hypoxylon rubiginosum]|uniref:Uncharacterized protein n=1 Tax=Hypoxylon rubiginosum TaxID=110542 RepID=A0ACC0D8E5_9PEZI|nr:hypothetical protein F4821DRAFT_257437 [Hypoxylon rubiginosum]
MGDRSFLVDPPAAPISGPGWDLRCHSTSTPEVGPKSLRSPVLHRPEGAPSPGIGEVSGQQHCAQIGRGETLLRPSCLFNCQKVDFDLGNAFLEQEEGLQAYVTYPDQTLFSWSEQRPDSKKLDILADNCGETNYDIYTIAEVARCPTQTLRKKKKAAGDLDTYPDDDDAFSNNTVHKTS